VSHSLTFSLQRSNADCEKYVQNHEIIDSMHQQQPAMDQETDSSSEPTCSVINHMLALFAALNVIDTITGIHCSRARIQL
jgi:hypothetical protein